MDVDRQSDGKSDAKVVVVANLTRNVVETHLKSVFGFYGEIIKIELPIYAKCVCLPNILGFFFVYLSPMFLSFSDTSCSR